MQNRRKFIGTACSFTAVGLLPHAVWSHQKTLPTVSRLKPKCLKQGDTIGLIAPGYGISETALLETQKNLGSMGLISFHTKRVQWKHGYFSNTDKERAADLMEMFANPNIDGILCIRGGYGCTRILHLLDYTIIANNPKVLIGFSDVTALLNSIYQKTGLYTFHGPVGSTLDDAYSQQQLAQITMHPQPKQLLQNANNLPHELLEQPEYERYVITPGKAQGKLMGGNLSLINALIGTPYEIDFTNSIVCIEDIEEAPYRIDRMLTQLCANPTFIKASAIVFGVCAGCNTSSNPNSFTLKEVIMDRIQPLGIPAVYGMSFGHVTQNYTFPIGASAILDTEKMQLQLLEKPVL